MRQLFGSCFALRLSTLLMAAAVLSCFAPANATVITAQAVGTVKAPVGQSFTMSVATFTDDNPAATAGNFTATIDWGDATLSAGIISGNASGFTASGTHTYAAPGTYTVNVTINDTSPGTGTAFVQDTFKVTDPADLQITKSGPVSVSAGNNITYTVIVTNNGPAQATNVTVNDAAPPNLTYVSATAPCASGFPCNLGTLNSTGTTTFTITYTVSPSFAGNITNTASVSADQFDPNTNTNNSSSTTATVSQSADLSITKTAPLPIVGGQNVTYTITVTNNGPSQAAAVTVNDPTPPFFTFVSNTGGCTTPFPCNLGPLNPNQTVTIQATFKVPSNFQGSTNTATVSSTTSDPNLANNTATFANGPAATPVPSTLTLVTLGLGLAALWRSRRSRFGS